MLGREAFGMGRTRRRQLDRRRWGRPPHGTIEQDAHFGPNSVQVLKVLRQVVSGKRLNLRFRAQNKQLQGEITRPLIYSTIEPATTPSIATIIKRRNQSSQLTLAENCDDQSRMSMNSK